GRVTNGKERALPESVCALALVLLFFFSSRRRHTISKRDWSSDVCSSDLLSSTWATCGGVGCWRGSSSWKTRPPAPRSHARRSSRSEERRVGKEWRKRRSTA